MLRTSRPTKVALAATAAVAATSILVGTQIVSGQSTAQETVFVPVVPCRLVDTRPGNNNIGPTDTKIGPAQTVTFNAHNGNDANSTCEIPATATAIATNTTAIQPSARTFITLFPANTTTPGTSNLNVLAGAAPTPNSVNVPLAPNGQFNVFNNAGNVNIAIDINGYYQPSTNTGTPGTPGPKGDPGNPGPAGTNGNNGITPVGPINRITNQQIATLSWHQDPGRETVIEIGNGFVFGIAYSGTNLYVTNTDDDTVSVIDPTTNTVTDTITVGDEPGGLAYNGTHLYVANLAGTVSVIDPTSNTVIDTITTVATAEFVASTGSHIYVSNFFGSVTVIDSTTNTVIDTIALPSNAAGIAYDGTNIHVARSGGLISVIDPTTNTIVDTITVGGSPRVVAVDGSQLYVTDPGAGTVTIVDLSTRTVIDTITVGGFTTGLAYTGTHMYVASSGGISVLDPSSNTVVDTVDINASGIQNIVFDGTNLWIVNNNDFVTKIIPG